MNCRDRGIVHTSPLSAKIVAGHSYYKWLGSDIQSNTFREADNEDKYHKSQIIDASLIVSPTEYSVVTHKAVACRLVALFKCKK